ncbi:MAG: TrkA family potassium uptake protein [Oscillospiraceae bacterium]|nr:TrkA family potassium uptake protein [Oscillospiraceae bacterium]
MNIIVVGCGKVGCKLADSLDNNGHDVSVVDQDELNFDRLSNDFNGFTTAGYPIDLDVLKKAGADNCDVLAAVTSNDNINIMVSQLAKEVLNVPNVIARIYDPKRKDVFSHFGIHTVCPTNLTVASVLSAIENTATKVMFNIGSHTINFYSKPIKKSNIGRYLYEIITDKQEIIFAIEHDDKSLTIAKDNNIKLKQGDSLVISKIID